MPNDRGGQVLKTGKIGKVNILRQQMISPGETINTSIQGNVKLESLRERDALRIHAHLACFVQPVRWLWPEWPQYLTEGRSGSLTPPVQLYDFSTMGLGGGSDFESGYRWFWDAPVNIYNNWYKWPEMNDVTGWTLDGHNAVPLSHSWSRTRQKRSPDFEGDYIRDTTSGAGGDGIDVRLLRDTEGSFKSALQRDVLSYGRYMELIQMMYNADGSREVDQVPIMIDQTEVGVNPREMPATDGPNLGQWQSLYDFNVDHSIRGITFPEHAILTYMLTVRFSSVSEQRNPLSWPGHNYRTLVLDHEALSQQMPNAVDSQELFTGNGDPGFDMGYLPAGWQWRSGFDVVDQRIDARDTFPYMQKPTTWEESKDASRVNPAFISGALGDYVADLYFKENSRSLANTAAESYYVGFKGGSNNDAHPYGGKML